MSGTFDDLQRMSEGGSEYPALQVLIAAALCGAYKRKEFMTVDQVLSRLMGKAPDSYVDDEDTNKPHPNKAGSFAEFCIKAMYPKPFEKQIDMFNFGMYSEHVPRLLLGSRGYGKTDYVVIMGIAYMIYLDPTLTFLIVTKSDERNAAMLKEIQHACECNGMVFEKANSECLRVIGLIGKDHSVSTKTIRSSGFRGRHPWMIIMDDPVTEEDTSEATRKHVQKLYNELLKLTQNLLIIGQPVHKYDLFETVRPLLLKMEVPHGMIPELDHDLDAQRLAGVSEESIQASYHLKVISEAGFPFETVKYVDKFNPAEGSVAFIDPAFKGVDSTALTILAGHFDGIQIQGHMHKKAWNHCLDDLVKQMRAQNVKRICFETNAIGDQPVIMLRQLFKGSGVGIVGKDSQGNKHARILSAGAYSHKIYLAKTSDRAYIDQVIKYEYGSKNDDAPDSLASCMEWVGLIKGKAKK